MDSDEMLSAMSLGYVYTVHNTMELLANGNHDERTYSTISKYLLTAYRQGALVRQRIAKKGSPYGYKLI